MERHTGAFPCARDPLPACVHCCLWGNGHKRQLRERQSLCLQPALLSAVFHRSITNHPLSVRQTEGMSIGGEGSVMPAQQQRDFSSSTDCEKGRLHTNPLNVHSELDVSCSCSDASCNEWKTFRFPLPFIGRGD